MNLRLLCLLLAGLASAASAPAETLEGHVVHVADGDTVTVYLYGSKEKVRVRLCGIDAPEKAQEHGDAAKRALAWFLDNNDVVVNYEEKDQYGRLVGQVSVDSADAGLFMLEAGHAWVYRSYARRLPAKWQQAYFAAERQARNRRLGLWSSASPTPPWEYRKAAKQQLTQENLVSDVTDIKEKLNGWVDKFVAWLKRLIEETLSK